MALEILSQTDDALVHVRLTGVMQLADQTTLQTRAKQWIDRGLKPRVLAVIENFQGWQKGVDWGDVTFLSTHGDDVAKIAIVGDPQWKDQAFMFLAKGLRATQIEYFAPSARAEAEAWIRK
jgi:hypothetical protein